MRSCGAFGADRLAGEEPDTEPFLEPANGVTQRRLRHPEPGSGSGEASLARDREEGD
jgi:hypothetical protein